MSIQSYSLLEQFSIHESRFKFFNELIGKVVLRGITYTYNLVQSCTLEEENLRKSASHIFQLYLL
jgi:hypothetical protein